MAHFSVQNLIVVKAHLESMHSGEIFVSWIKARRIGFCLRLKRELVSVLVKS